MKRDPLIPVIPKNRSRIRVRLDDFYQSYPLKPKGGGLTAIRWGLRGNLDVKKKPSPKIPAKKEAPEN